MFSKSSLILIAVSIAAYFWLYRLKRGPVYNSNKSLEGKTILITGGNTGIGKETAIELAKKGAKIIIASRNVQKSKLAQKEIIEKTKNSKIQVYKLDLADFENVRAFAKSFAETEEHLDILINNAGALDIPGVLPSGLNRMYAVNHFGPFLLTNLLLDKMKSQSKKRPVKIINVSSFAYIFASYSEDLLEKNATSAFELGTIYASTKLANIYFTTELNERIKDYDITTYSLHPGTVATELGGNFPEPLRSIIVWIAPLFVRSPYYGAQTTLYCALDDDITQYSGDFFCDCARFELEEHAKNKTLQKLIWKKSVEVTGLKEV